MDAQKYFETFAGGRIVAYDVYQIPKHTVGRVNNVLDSGLLQVYWHELKKITLVDPISDHYKVHTLCKDGRKAWIERQTRIDAYHNQQRKLNR